MFPIGVHHIKRLLELVGLTTCQERDVLVTMLGTVMCMRVVELAYLQVCDILWDLDAAFHVMYLGTLAVHIYIYTGVSRTQRGKGCMLAWAWRQMQLGIWRSGCCAMQSATTCG